MYERLALQLPDELKGVPEPPSVERCGPNHDGTWTSEGAGSVRYTKLGVGEFRNCLVDFARYAFKCNGDLMYQRTDECVRLTEFW